MDAEFTERVDTDRTATDPRQYRATDTGTSRVL
jgi:hypothetical protein